MKRCIAGFSLLLLLGIIFSAQSQTNSVRTYRYYDNNTPPSQDTFTEYTDGLGRVLQTRLELGGNKGRIIGKQYDALGRDSCVTVPFTVTTAGYFTGVVTTEASKREAYAYSEIRYKPDPLNRPDSVGAPGQAYSLHSGTTHFTRTWYLATNHGTAVNGNTKIDTTGFVIEANLTNTNLNSYESGGLGVTTPPYSLIVSKGANDNSYAQETKDKFGRSVAKCNMLGILSTYTYDIVGNCLSQNPSHSVTTRRVDPNLTSTYRYDTRGNIISKHTPDAGIVNYTYDNAGRLVAMQDAKQYATSSLYGYYVYLYDSFGRNYATGLNATQTSFTDAAKRAWALGDLGLTVRRIYDDPQQLQTVLGSSLATIASSLTNTRGRLVAEVAYTAGSDPNAQGFFNTVSIDIYSYDEDGNVITKIKRVPGADYVYFNNSYDLQGNPIQASIDDGIYDGNTKSLTYVRDNHGRVNQMQSIAYRVGNVPFINYTYDDYGRLTKKAFGDNVQNAIADSINYTYTIRDQVSQISSASAGFLEKILFETAPTPQYNGNIGQTQNTYKTASSTVYNVNATYTYDKDDRLTAMAMSDQTNFTNQQFTYLNDGKINTKQNGTQAAWGYSYYANSNQLEKISNNPRSAAKNYLYDPNGNMVLDCSKKMLIDYDWRNMPIHFKFFDQIPQSAINAGWYNLEYNITHATPTFGTLLNQVDAMYDVSGNRVIKRSSAFGYVNYEDRYIDKFVVEYNIVNSDSTKYLDFGDGRIEFPVSRIQNKRLYIKDHIGSTRMAVAGDGTIVESSFYDAYGAITQSSLAANEYRGKDKFTGKELDADGMGLYYFGARYYDADVGIWTSCDLAGQFWNPYGYHSNPVRFIDPDGELFETLFSAFIETIIPGFTLTTKIGSAINAAISQEGFGHTWEGFGRGVGAAVVDFTAGLATDVIGPAVSAVNGTQSLFNNWGSDKWSTQLSAIWDNEVADFKNIGASGNFWDYCSNLNESSLNDGMSGIYGIQYSASKDATYHGLISDDRGYTGQLWEMRNISGSNNYGGYTIGHHILMEVGYANNRGTGWNQDSTSFISSADQIIRHEMTHVGQWGRYGIGGFLMRESYGRYISDFPANDIYHQAMYGDYSGNYWLNVNEIEAQDAIMR